MIPARNNYWLLDSVAGWRIDSNSPVGIAYTAVEGDITLDPLPGSAIALPAELVSEIDCPVAVAGDQRGNAWVLDGASNLVSVLDIQANRARRVRAFGGPGVKLREFQRPRSLTVLPSGTVAVADTGNNRVQLFSAAPYALLQVWGAPEVAMKPCAVASDHCGIVYIVDRRSRSILRVCASGEWLEPVGAGVLTDPVELAVSKDQTIAVVDGQGANASIVLFPAKGGKPVNLKLVQLPLCLAFDDAGNLFCGTGNALVSKIEPDSAQPIGWSLGGDGVSDLDGSVVKVAWIEGQGIYAILKSASAGVAPQLFSMNPAGAYRLSGSFLTQPLESNIENCSWHRVQVVGTVPAGTSLAIKSSTSESANSGFSAPQICMSATGDNPDCLLQSPPGRYLKLQFTLTSSGATTPQIHAIKVYFPRQSYLQYLPAVFQDDSQSRLFLDRFLSIFQTTFDDFDGFLDNLWQIFDPYMTPDTVFPWLAAWIALPLDPNLTPARKRQLLKTAFQYNQIRGTPAGLQQVIGAYTGVSNTRIVEDWKLRNWTALPLTGGLDQGARLWSRNLYARLQVAVSSQVGSFKLTNSPEPASEPDDWGANRFSIMFPANPYTAASTSAQVQKIVDREKPVYTEARLCPVFQRLRVGVQATLGVDAYVGKTTAAVLGKLSTLRYDAVLAHSQQARERQALGLSVYPRLGVDAKIL
jgi:phage tail-like protein